MWGPLFDTSPVLGRHLREEARQSLLRVRHRGQQIHEAPEASLRALEETGAVQVKPIWLWVKTNGIPFRLVGEFTTLRTNLSGWIESDVRWGLTDLALDFLSHGHWGRVLGLQAPSSRSKAPLGLGWVGFQTPSSR